MLERLRVWMAVVLVGMMVGPALIAAGAENSTGRSTNIGPDISEGLFFEDFNYSSVTQLTSAGWAVNGLSAQTTGTSVILDNDGSSGTILSWNAWPNDVINYTIEIKGRWIGRSVGTISGGNPTDGVTYWSYYADGSRGQYVLVDNASTSGQEISLGAYTPVLNAWHVLSTAKSGNTFSFYDNGALLGTRNSPFSHGALNTLTIQSGFASTVEFDWVRVMWDVLTPVESNLNLTADRSIYKPGEKVTLNASITNVQWTWVQKMSGATARNFHTAVWGSQNNQMLVFGGTSPTGALPHSNDLWAYNPSTGFWTQKASADPAKGRVQHSAVWDSQNNQMLIFGGYDGINRLNDTWAYSPSMDTWSPKASGPSARYYHSAVWDDQNNQMLVFGGFDGAYKNDLWAYFPSNNTWVQKANGAIVRDAHTAVWDSQNKQMLVFGGDDGTGTRVNDLWAYIPANDTWTKKKSGATPRYEHNAVWNSNDNQMLVFGGSGTIGNLNDFWAYSPLTDSWAKKGNGATARTTSSAVWDYQSNQMILFGGYGASLRLNDTWVTRIISQPVSNHGLEWLEENVTYLSPGLPGSPDAGYLRGPSVVQLINGSYRMYYYGSQTGANPYNILSAFSSDGVAWSKEPGIRIQAGDSNDLNKAQSPLAVLLNDGRIRVYYQGDSNPWWYLLSAISNDGLSFTKELGVRIMPSGQSIYVTPAAYVWLSNGSIRLFYMSSPTSISGSRIYSATSQDGLSFVIESGYRLDIGNDAVNSISIYGGVIYSVHPGFYRFYYTARAASGSGHGDVILSAISDDLINWTKEAGIRIDSIQGEELAAGGILTLNNGSIRIFFDDTGPGNVFAIKSAISIPPFGPISFEADDPSSQPYFLMTNKTNSTGDATVSFTLPPDAPEGVYNCSATANVSGTVLLATTSFQVVWPWSPVMTVTTFYSTVDHGPGDLIEILAYTGYRYSPADSNKTAPGSNLTAAVTFPNGTAMMSVNNQTTATGWANMSFVLPDTVVNGTYNVTITGFKNQSRMVQFNVFIPPPTPYFGFKTITIPVNVNRGAAFKIDVVINNSLGYNMNCLLVVQILDSNNVPLRPQIKTLDVPVSSDFLTNLTINPITRAGSYNVQFQLLTKLPKDRGYALDFWNDVIIVH